MSKILKIVIAVFAALALIAFVLCLIDWAIRYFLSCILAAILFIVSIA
jgi:fatty acid desaturase